MPLETLKKDISDLTTAKEFINVEWLAEDTVVIVTLKTVTRASIDVCQQILTRLTHQWSHEQIFAALYDFPEVGLTPYLRQKMNEVRDAKPVALKCRLAVMIPANSLGYIMYLYWHAYPQGNPDMQVQMFEDRDAALAWLLQKTD